MKQKQKDKIAVQDRIWIHANITHRFPLCSSGVWQVRKPCSANMSKKKGVFLHQQSLQDNEEE